MLLSFQFIMTYWTLLENFQIWTPEPIARIYLDDCIKYIGEDTKRPQNMVICFVYIL